MEQEGRMSSIYIPNVDLPTDGDFELWIAVKKDGSFIYNVHGGWHDGEKKVIPVPDHGRLIDATAKVQTQLYDDEHEEWTDAEMTVDEYLGYCFNEVPTVIPATTKENEHGHT